MLRRTGKGSPDDGRLARDVPRASAAGRRPGGLAIGLVVALHGLGLIHVAVAVLRGSGVGLPWAGLGLALLLVGDAFLLWTLRRRSPAGEERTRSEGEDGAGAAPEGTPAVPRVLAGPGRAASHGPRVVAVGGGHGLSTLLRGIKSYTDDVTAIVTVADDGGSSGVLRQELGLPPPGDLRDCIAALADAEPLMALLFQYRFGRDTRLGGHAFGNLFIAAMTGITGDFESAVSAASHVLAVRGRILPSSLDNIELCAEVRHGSVTGLVCGQSRIAAVDGAVERVFLQPEAVKAHPEAVRALLEADLIVMGPGSLYTSVLPNLLIPAIRDAVRASEALRVYVCNVATQPGETGGYDLEAHVRALLDHVGPDVCDVVIGNHNVNLALPPESGSEAVRPSYATGMQPPVVLRDLVDPELHWRHDPGKLAAVVMELYGAHVAGVAVDATA